MIPFLLDFWTILDASWGLSWGYVGPMLALKPYQNPLQRKVQKRPQKMCARRTAGDRDGPRRIGGILFLTLNKQDSPPSKTGKQDTERHQEHRVQRYKKHASQLALWRRKA